MPNKRIKLTSGRREVRRPLATYPSRCADASACRASWRTPSSPAVELVIESCLVAPWEPRIGAAAQERRPVRLMNHD